VLMISALVAVMASWCTYNVAEGDQYQMQSASGKMNYLWGKILENPGIGSFPSAFSLAYIFVESMQPSFDHVGDEMPCGRSKLIHGVGTIAKAKFVADKSSPYSGIFKGSNNMLLRMSHAKAPEKDLVVPGWSMKFLIDGVPSANMFSLVNLKGQSEKNVFVNPYTNHPELDPATAGLAEKALKAKFSTASQWPRFLGASYMAQYTESGEAVRPVFPFELVFVGTAQMESQFEGTDPYTTTFDRMFSGIRPGTVLLDVMARSDPDSDLQLIGSVVTVSNFVGSKYADETLFFEHTRMEDDFGLRPDWLSDEDRAETFKMESGDMATSPSTVSSSNNNSDNNSQWTFGAGIAIGMGIVAAVALIVGLTVFKLSSRRVVADNSYNQI